VQKSESEKELLYEKEKFKKLIEQIPAIAVQGYTADREVIYWNKASEELYGYTEEEALGKKLEDLIIPDFMREGVIQLIADWMDNDVEIPAAELVLKNKNNQDVNVFSQHVKLDIDETKSEFFCLDIDISPFKKLETTLSQQKEQLELAQTNAHVGSWELDMKTKKLTWSDETYRIFGYKPNSVTPTLKLFYKQIPKRFIHKIFYSLPKVLKSGQAQEVEHPLMLPNGDKRFVRSRGDLSYDDKGKAKAFFGTVLDITLYHETLQELGEQKEKLFFQANHDTLTGMPNRSLFLDRLRHALSRREAKGKHTAVLFLDLDHFKEINDTMGHFVGDKVLIEVSKRLADVLRQDDTIARLGGDEFTIILEQIVNPFEVGEVAQKLIASLSEPIVVNEQMYYVTVSIGIAIAPDDASKAEDLLKYADSAMYKAKENGRNTYEYYTSDLSERAFERLLLESNIRKAIKEKEFVLFYQPQIDAKSKKIIGFEALIRWNHPQMGMVSPAKFIPLAEETGHIIAIGRWVLMQAMKDIAYLKTSCLTCKRISVNVSVKQIQDSDFVESVKELILESGCNPRDIELEVTEGYIMDEPEKAILTLNELHNLGFALAIDDFGTGYSSLAYLKRFPIQKLKIDQSFVRDIPGDEDDESIVKAVILIAESMKLDVIAEGVENTEQEDFLMEHGCFLIQGFLYARPMPLDELNDFLKVYQ